jgi:hypothetical protein
MRILLAIAALAAQVACIHLPWPPSFASSALSQKSAQKSVEIRSFSALQQLLQSLQVDTHVAVLLPSDLLVLTVEGRAKTEPFARELQRLLRTLSEFGDEHPLLTNLKQRYNFHVSTLPVDFAELQASSGGGQYVADVTAALEAVHAKHGAPNTLFLLSSPLRAIFTDKGRTCGAYGGIGASSYAWLALQQPRIFRYGPSHGEEGFVDSLGSFLTSTETWREVEPEKLKDGYTDYMAHFIGSAAAQLMQPNTGLPPFLDEAGLSNPKDTAALVFRSAQALFPQFESFDAANTPPQKVVVLAVHLKLFDEGSLHPGRRGGSLKSKQLEGDFENEAAYDDDDADDFDDDVTRDRDANLDVALDPVLLTDKLRTLFESAAKEPGWPQVRIELLSSLSRQQQTQLEICVSLAVDGVAEHRAAGYDNAAPRLNPGFRRIHSPILMDCAAQVFEIGAKDSAGVHELLQERRTWSAAGGISPTSVGSGSVHIVPLLLVEDRSEVPLVLEGFKLADVLASPANESQLHPSDQSMDAVLRRSPRVLAVYSQANEDLNSPMACYRNDQDEYVQLPLDDRLFQIEILRATIAAVTGHEPHKFFDSISGMAKRDYLWAHPRSSPAVSSTSLDARELQYPARASIIRQADEITTSVTDSLTRFQRWQLYFGADFEESVLAVVQPQLAAVVVALDDLSFQYSHNEFARALEAVSRAKQASSVLEGALKELSSRTHETIFPADTTTSSRWTVLGVYASYLVVGALAGGVAVKVLRDQLTSVRVRSTKRRLGTFAR